MRYADSVMRLREPATRFEVATSLRASLPGSVDALLEGLKSGPPSVRRWCALVLDHAPHDARIEEALRAATKDRTRKVRRAALHALACAPCKPDGCLTTDGVGFLVDGLLNDRSLRVRRGCAGELMWGQAGRSDRISAAFRAILKTDADPVLRERAAIFLAWSEVPRSDRPFAEWHEEWRQRIGDLVGL